MKDELIDLVFCAPALWDKRHKQHHNRHVLAREWKKIAAKIGVTDTEARKCWKNFRQEYGKQIKKIQVRSGDEAGDEIVSEWPYFKKLHFLRDQFTPRQSSTNLMDETQGTVDSNSEEPLPSEESDSDDEQSTFTSIANVMSPSSDSQNVVPSSSSRATSTTKYSISQTGYKRRITPQIEIGKQLVDIEKEKLTLRANKMSQDPNDEDIGFFNSLLPYVKKLTPRDKLKFRLDVQNYLVGILFPPEQQMRAPLGIPIQLPAQREQTPQHNPPLSQPIGSTNGFQPYQPPSANETANFAAPENYINL